MSVKHVVTRLLIEADGVEEILAIVEGQLQQRHKP